MIVLHAFSDSGRDAGGGSFINGNFSVTYLLNGPFIPSMHPPFSKYILT